ncbi:MAG TPA: nucleoside hydrolase [Bryobacteraceae bacterium]
MLRNFLAAFLLFSSLCVAHARAAEPVRLIFDTDIGNDVDDAMALAMIHALESRGEARLLAVTITKDNRYAAPFVSLVNSFYGQPDIPIGVVRHGKTPQDSAMLRIPVRERDAGDHFIYPREMKDSGQAPGAVELLQHVLRRQPDHSVVIAQTGFSTNLARLLQAPGGRTLVARKVKALYLMAGNFSKPIPEFNVATDPQSAAYLFAHWPTPMIFSDFTIGLAITFPYAAIAHDFGYVAHHPIAEAYKIYVKKPVDHPDWDATAVLEAIRPDRGYFNLSAPGRVKLGPKNTTIFVPDPHGNARYLILKPHQVSRLRQLIATLVSEPPHCACR